MPSWLPPSLQAPTTRKCCHAARCRLAALTCSSPTIRCWSTCFCGRSSGASSIKRLPGWLPINRIISQSFSTRLTCIAARGGPKLLTSCGGFMRVLASGGIGYGTS